MLEHDESAFYAPLISDWRDLETFEAPTLDEAIAGKFTAFTDRRRGETGSGPPSASREWA